MSLGLIFSGIYFLACLFGLAFIAYVICFADMIIFMKKQ